MIKVQLSTLETDLTSSQLTFKVILMAKIYLRTKTRKERTMTLVLHFRAGVKTTYSKTLKASLAKQFFRYLLRESACRFPDWR